MAGPSIAEPTTQIAALHIGSMPIHLDGLSVSIASWSIAGSATVVLSVFLGRLAAQWWRTRRQDQGIIILIQAQLRIFEPRYRAWPQTSRYLRAKWDSDPMFQPFSSSSGSIDRPYDRHRDRLPVILSPDLYHALLSFYEHDRHFDDARAAVLTQAFVTLPLDRRLTWLDFLDELAAEQAKRCQDILAGLELPGGPWGRIRHRLKAPPSAHDHTAEPALDTAAPHSRSNDGENRS